MSLPAFSSPQLRELQRVIASSAVGIIFSMSDPSVIDRIFKNSYLI
jgi:hypothetical protein